MALIALTGASGRIATALRPRLRAAGHRLVLCDAPGVAVPGVDAATERAVACDLRDVDGQAEAFAGADLVVHLGAYSDERPWEDILAVNIDGTRAVCEAARRAGVGRMLLASSVHAAGYVPADSPLVREGMPLPAPDTYYGVSKAALEALGGLYAGRFGMTVVSARIMVFRDIADGPPPSLRSWFSPDDMARLVLATLTTTATGHHVVLGRLPQHAPGRGPRAGARHRLRPAGRRGGARCRRGAARPQRPTRDARRRVRRPGIPPRRAARRGPRRRLRDLRPPRRDEVRDGAASGVVITPLVAAPSGTRSARSARFGVTRSHTAHCLLVTREWRNGRRAGFRCQCPKGRGGSNPPSRTQMWGIPHDPGRVARRESDRPAAVMSLGQDPGHLHRAERRQRPETNRPPRASHVLSSPTTGPPVRVDRPRLCDLTRLGDCPPARAAIHGRGHARSLTATSAPPTASPPSPAACPPPRRHGGGLSEAVVLPWRRPARPVRDGVRRLTAVVPLDAQHRIFVRKVTVRARLDRRDAAGADVAAGSVTVRPGTPTRPELTAVRIDGQGRLRLPTRVLAVLDLGPTDGVMAVALPQLGELRLFAAADVAQQATGPVTLPATTAPATTPRPSAELPRRAPQPGRGRRSGRPPRPDLRRRGRPPAPEGREPADAAIARQPDREPYDCAAGSRQDLQAPKHLTDKDTFHDQHRLHPPLRAPTATTRSPRSTAHVAAVRDLSPQACSTRPPWDWPRAEPQQASP